MTGRCLSFSLSRRLKSFCSGGSKPRSRRAVSRLSLAERVSRGLGARTPSSGPGKVGEDGDGKWGIGIVSRILGFKKFRIVRDLEAER